MGLAIAAFALLNRQMSGVFIELRRCHIINSKDVTALRTRKHASVLITINTIFLSIREANTLPFSYGIRLQGFYVL